MAKSIQNKNELIEAVGYVARETTRLCKSIVGETFPIESLTVFAHSEPEYELLVEMLGTIGKPYNYNNGPRVELFEPIVVDDNKISHLRVRKPDLERPQAGCNDLVVDYELFKKDFLFKYPDNIRLIKRPEYEMIELFSPEFDVLAYVVSDEVAKAQKIQSIYNDFIIKLNGLKNKQFDFLKKLFAKKQAADLEDLRKNLRS
jgi:hypothetical protein